MNLHRALTLALVIGPLVLNTTTSQASASNIRWEVENGFRYFKRASDFREFAKVYAEQLQGEGRRPSVLQLEAVLEEKVRDGKFNGIQGADKRLGWAASIYLQTCGRQDGDTGPHVNCKMTDGEPYLEPKATNILLYIDGVSAGSCTWTIDGVPMKPSVNCNERINIRVTYDEPHHAEVKTPDGTVVKTDILVKDILIISLGDSFSAGEGNPERPVAFSNDASFYNNSSSHWFKADQFPIREPIDTGVPVSKAFWEDHAANWTNSQCHRSLYSQHTRAALQYALEHPHVSVTYMNYSCTGAEVFEGILNAWWARDVEKEFWDDAPQLVKVLRDLCKDPSKYKETNWTQDNRNDKDFDSAIANIPKCDSFRVKKIDAVLLSIGGNDIGFARLIANAAIDIPEGPLANGRKWAYGLWREASQPLKFSDVRETAQKTIATRYKALATELDAYFAKQLALSGNKIILSAYPDISTSESGAVCSEKVDRLGMDVHVILGMNNPSSSAESGSFTHDLDRIMKTEAKNQHWRFADQHIALDRAPNNFTKDKNGVGHGICATNTVDPEQADLPFPRPEEGSTAPYDWKHFAPRSWRPYTARNRWVVTPNDAFLTTNYNQRYGLAINDELQPLYAATLSGSFHPNALGHAALADSVLVELRDLLKDYEDH